METFINLSDNNRQLEIFDLGTLPFVVALPTGAVSDELEELVGEIISRDEVSDVLEATLFGHEIGIPENDDDDDDDVGMGIDNVRLIGLDVDNVTLELTNGDGVRDIAVIDNVGDEIASIAADLSDHDDDDDDGPDFNIGDDISQFAILDFNDSDQFDLGSRGSFGERNVQGFLRDIQFDRNDDLTLLGIDQDNLTIAVSTGDATDVLVIDGVGDAIDSVANDFIRLNNTKNQIGVFDFNSTDQVFIGGTDNVSREFGRIVNGRRMNEDEAEALVTELLLGDGVRGVELINVDDDTATIAISGSSDDILIIDNISGLSDLMA
ncbi:hypothetical protein [Acuticoccus sp.]|uniref:hypothetical protein n=1 Tax=Acuticoccus sp. TaxID=1904378 RepID=UPI003B52576B